MYLYLKALHLIFVVSWFAGLFYMVRLFIYHTEAEEQEPKSKGVLFGQFKIMEQRLWQIITWPAAVLATVFGYWMVIELNLWSQGWMMLKLGLTSLLWGYHLATHWLYLRYQRDELVWSSTQLRLWNELATLWLVAIVFVVVLKGTLNWIYGTLGFFAVGVLLMVAVRTYKRLRK
jgi:putative membrane protein